MFYNDSIDIWSKVYFIQAEIGGPIKIGSTDYDSPEKRLEELQTGNPEKLVILHWTTGGKALEFHLHNKFKKYHKFREWFWPEKELLDLIVEFKFEDDFFGRMLSIVDFAKKEGYSLEEDEWKTLVHLSRGAILQTDNLDTKLRYWKILDSYRTYFDKFPSKLRSKRGFTCCTNEGRQPTDLQIKKQFGNA
ncbi:GIY-YIG nuclease family protein [Brevibacillus borstelensis]|uniref:GIY-YIG nuclease family protein n=1 Tax=Brevibacillus borstelensis TaxID=45462 RepID=UPI0030F9E397